MLLGFGGALLGVVIASQYWTNGKAYVARIRPFFHSKQSQRTAFIHRQQVHFISPHCERIVLPKSFAIVIVSRLVIDSLNTLTFSFIFLPTFGYFIVPSRLDSSSSFSLLTQCVKCCWCGVSEHDRNKNMYSKLSRIVRAVFLSVLLGCQIRMKGIEEISIVHSFPTVLNFVVCSGLDSSHGTNLFLCQ